MGRLVVLRSLLTGLLAGGVVGACAGALSLLDSSLGPWAWVVGAVYGLVIGALLGVVLASGTAFLAVLLFRGRASGRRRARILLTTAGLLGALLGSVLVTEVMWQALALGVAVACVTWFASALCVPERFEWIGNR